MFEASITTERPASRLASIRHALDAWLKQRGLSQPERGYVVLAAHEALANAIEHSQAPGPITVRADETAAEFMVEITDNGHWKPAPETRNSHIAEGRGRGLMMIKELVSYAKVVSEARGTTVRLHQHR